MNAQTKFFKAAPSEAEEDEILQGFARHFLELLREIYRDHGIRMVNRFLRNMEIYFSDSETLRIRFRNN